MTTNYETKRGEILAVMAGPVEVDGVEVPRFSTFILDKTGEILGRKEIAALPPRETEEEAQKDLDNYALGREYNVASEATEPPSAPEDTDAHEGAGEGTQEEGAASAPSSIGPESAATLATLREELQRLVEEEMREKDAKALDNASHNAALKAIDERKAKLLREIHAEENLAREPHLPFGGPVAIEVKGPEENTLDGEPALVKCLPCQGTGALDDGQECPDCMGAGKVVPPEPFPESEGGACRNCDHPAAAHFDADGNLRPCILDKCGCLIYEPQEPAGEESGDAA